MATSVSAALHVPAWRRPETTKLASAITRAALHAPSTAGRGWAGSRRSDQRVPLRPSKVCQSTAPPLLGRSWEAAWMERMPGFVKTHRSSHTVQAAQEGAYLTLHRNNPRVGAFPRRKGRSCHSCHAHQITVPGTHKQDADVLWSQYAGFTMGSREVTIE